MKGNICSGLTFEECELTILRMAIDKVQEKIGRRIVSSEDIKKIIKIVEDFISVKNLICYGGTAINNILPEDEQFYNKEAEIPDYDFFSCNALDDAKELADIYYKNGFTDVEARAGQHHGTYKVFVNFIPIADVTMMHKDIFAALKQDSIRIKGILYASPNFLRMGMYSELSKPVGDTSRWEKVLKRLILLNKHYKITDIDCDKVQIQREMEEIKDQKKIYENLKDTLISQGVVFFGSYALSLYSNYIPKKHYNKNKEIPDFDVLSNDPETTCDIVKERLKDIGINNVKFVKRESNGEIIPDHYEVKIGNDSVVFIYKPIGCHSYNTITSKKHKIKVATIDTMLSFYLAFLYANKPYYNQYLDRLLCMSKFLFDIQEKNRLKQSGPLKRFSITCYGHQSSLEEMRAEKSKKYKELKDKKNTREYEEWFLKYEPDEKNVKIKNQTSKKKKINNNSNKTSKQLKKNHKTNKKNKTNKNTKFLGFL